MRYTDLSLKFVAYRSLGSKTNFSVTGGLRRELGEFYYLHLTKNCIISLFMNATHNTELCKHIYAILISYSVANFGRITCSSTHDVCVC